jgi:integrating conjugative element relaxase (TIGR03760 family)
VEIALFHRPGKKPTSALTKPLKDLMAIVAPAQLLAETKRHDLMKKIRDHSSFETNRFDQIALTLVHNFINHVQNIPETAHSYYASTGGLLDHALNRTEAALDLFRNYVIQEGEELSEEQQLWVYVLFSAGILQGIGKLQIDYKVDLFDTNGQYIKQWNPLLENLPSAGSYYQFEFQHEQEEDFRRRLNLLMARLIMPHQGFIWIASNPQALGVWLALLNEDWQSAGTLGAILVRADAIAIQRYFNEFMHRVAANKGRLNRITTFVDTGGPETAIDKERQLGVEFIQWLTKALEKGQLVLNKAPLFMVPGGLLMSVEIFKWFVREHPEYKSWQAIHNAFVAMGLTRERAGNLIARYEQINTQQMLSGIVMSNYAVALPPVVQVHNANTGKVNPMTAIEVMNQAQTLSSLMRKQAVITSTPLLHLAENGQWCPADSVSPQLQPGSTHSA